MNLRLLFYITSFFFAFQGFSQWQWQNPLPQGNSLLNVRFISEQTGFATGMIGTIIKTEDAGQSWTVLNTETRYSLWDISFPTQTVGFAVGGSKAYDPDHNSIVIKTTDGGQTWNSVYSDTLGTLYSVCFPTLNTGYVVGMNGKVIKTTDGGNTWQKLNVSTNNVIRKVYFMDPLVGFITGQKILKKTTNGGLTWTNVTAGVSGQFDFIDISFPSPDIGYVIANNNSEGVIAESSDGGDFWTVIKTVVRPLSSVKFMTPDTGYIAGQMTNLRTTDGGQTWETVNTELYSPHADFTSVNIGYIIDGDDSWMMNDPKVYKTMDFGTSWNPLTSAVTYCWLEHIEFPSPKTGFALGQTSSYGNVIKTSDGKHWNLVLSTGDTGIAAGSFPDSLHGFVCGSINVTGYQRCFLYRTINGGNTWTMSLAGNYAPVSISFPNPDTGYLTNDIFTGSSSVYEILRTTDGGLNWQIMHSDSTAVFSKVIFRAPKKGFVLQGTNWSTWAGLKVYRTMDAGITWFKCLDVSDFFPTDMFFLDELTGFVSAYKDQDNCILLRTNDGGDNWTSISTGNAMVSKVFFINPLIGYITDSWEKMMKTTDGGLTWENLVYPGLLISTDMFFVNEDTGYITGPTGNIMYTENGCYVVSQPSIPAPVNAFSKNYPNPFSSVTTIDYHLNEESRVTIEIFELSGTRIKSWVIADQIPGDYRFPFDASGLTDGVYFYRIRTNTRIETKKMIIIH